MSKIDVELMLEHDFMAWCEQMRTWGAWMAKPDEFFLTPTCSASFVLAAEDDDQLSLGVLESYAKAFSYMAPNEAALLRNLKGGNWLGLNVPDVSAERDGVRMTPLRVFLPIDSVKMDVFVGAPKKPSLLRVRSLRVKASGKLLLAGGTPRAELPLSYFGFKPARAGGKTPPAQARAQR